MWCLDTKARPGTKPLTNESLKSCAFQFFLVPEKADVSYDSDYDIAFTWFLLRIKKMNNMAKFRP